MIRKNKVLFVVLLVAVLLIIRGARNRGEFSLLRNSPGTDESYDKTQTGADDNSDANEPSDTGGLPGDTLEYTLLSTNGGRLDWSKNNKIAFDKRNTDGYYDVYISDGPEGIDSASRCLTCSEKQFDRRHAGNPAWHPDGNLIVFQAQAASQLSDYATPGKGYNNDLWVTDSAGSNFWRILDLTNQAPYGVLHPHFSHDGTKLTWAQMIKPGETFGYWQIKLADFSIQNGVPKLINIRSFKPGSSPKFYETHGFTKDDKKLIFSSNSDGQNVTGLDIYVMDIASGQTVNLTNSLKDWDEHAQLSPDGSKIVWSSSSGNRIMQNELWIMDIDGKNKKQLSNFHDRPKPYFIGAKAFGPADASWSPDGKSLITYAITNTADGGGKIYLLK